MYLDEHHSFLRQGCGVYVFKKTVGRRLLGRTFDEAELEHHRDLLDRAMKLLETRLTLSNKYLCGDHKTIADLSACCELDQLKFVEINESVLALYPKTKAWLHRMIDECPILLQIH